MDAWLSIQAPLSFCVLPQEDAEIIPDRVSTLASAGFQPIGRDHGKDLCEAGIHESLTGRHAPLKPNMDVIKMIHVKGQAAKRLQELGKIHAMGKSKYAWPMGERHPPDPGISDVEAMIQTSIEMQTDALHRSAPPEQAAGPRPGLRLRREVQHGMAPQEDPSSAAEERSLGAGHEGHVVIPVAPDDFADRRHVAHVDHSAVVPEEDETDGAASASRRPARLEAKGATPDYFECLPVWCGRGQVSTANLSFVERYRAARRRAGGEIREVLRPDAEAPSRARARCNWEQLHEMPAPERKEITMELKPQIIGEEVPLSALEDLPNQTEGPEVIQEEKEEEKRPAASTAPDKKSILSLLRGCARSIMNSPGFEPVVLFVIVISSVSLAFENPFQDPNSEVTFLQDVIDKFSVGVITLEMIVRMLVMGLWKRPSDCEPGELPGYFRVPWHVLDFVICLGGLTYVLAEFFTTNLNDLKSIRVLKMVSMLRPLRLIGKTSSVRLIIEALLAAIPTLINMSLMSAMFFLGFSLLFVGFFKGALYRCTLDPLGDLRPDIVTRKDCLKAGGEWINSQSHFDRVTDSLVALMHIGSGEGWIDVTLNIISAQGIDLQPRPKTRLEQAIPVVIFMALTNFFLMNLLTGILVDSYTSTKAEFKGQSADTSEERLLKKLQREILMNPELLIPPRRMGVKGKCFAKVRQRLKVFIEHRMSRSVIFVGILSNALVLRGSLAAGVWSNAQAAKGSEGV
ncbi:Sodium channel protein 60E (Drosophila ion channel 60) (Drosophila sodium channel 1) (Protein smell-impaired 60E) (Sodium channel 2) (DmNav2) [Durusdinium trenchii]|uniref:Sodium channel protein 60E (Drosophila ion channel 60) (Drosophila sodium channel 1) (Protein smell-impaired 60E) (Sodium channel 2) (DmNav2) n=1 Tax=Durusdinium trenchii TaxID=1381693 RepID=A0ABP0Q095_9DINO